MNDGKFYISKHQVDEKEFAMRLEIAGLKDKLAASEQAVAGFKGSLALLGCKDLSELLAENAELSKALSNLLQTTGCPTFGCQTYDTKAVKTCYICQAREVLRKRSE